MEADILRFRRLLKSGEGHKKSTDSRGEIFPIEGGRTGFMGITYLFRAVTQRDYCPIVKAYSMAAV